VARELKPDFPVPRHVAIIMDGNGRWALGSGFPRIRGHENGVEAVRDTTEAATAWGIEHLTLYAFSVENWQRPRRETKALMRLLQRFLLQELPTLQENGVRLQGFGRLEDLPEEVRQTLREVEEKTAAGTAMTLRLALSYGGRQELADAARRMARAVSAGNLSPEEIDTRTFGDWLYDPGMPDPDLIIRTAGEQRMSNFLLWEASYAEFFTTPVLWPDFRREHLYQALQEYHRRVRKFGRVLTSPPAVPSAD